MDIDIGHIIIPLRRSRPGTSQTWTLSLWLCVLLCSQTVLSTNLGNKAVRCKPREVHLAYGDSTSEMIVVWSTQDLCSPAKVQYSTNAWGLDTDAPGDSRVFEEAAGLKSNLHRVKLRNLHPDSTYFYKPNSYGVTAGPFMFKTPPANEASSEVQFLVVSDVSSTSPTISTINEEAQTGKYSAILHAGNIAMNMSSSNGKVASTYFNLLEPAARVLAYMVAPGPGEQEGGEYSHYMQRFSMPTVSWPMNRDKLWYSVDIGNTHVISLSTEVFFTNKGQYSALQHDWLIRDLKLANTNREKVPWVVAFAHRPMYCSYEDPSLQCNMKTSQVKKGLEDILYRYGADVVIQSYGAAYERSYPQFKGVPVNDNYTDPLAPVHIMTGGATPWEFKFNFTEKTPKWSAFRYTNQSVMSYGRLHVINATHLHYQQVAADSQDIIDEFTIVQNKHGQFSFEDLPENVSATIDKNIKEAGGKPGVLNVNEIGDAPQPTRIQELLHGDNRNRIIIAAVGGFVALLLAIALVAMRKCRKKRRTTRRWEQMDINYGKKFYSKAPDRDEDNDFEIDMSDGTEGTRQLLSE